jgi:hypothetical protein
VALGRLKQKFSQKKPLFSSVQQCTAVYSSVQQCTTPSLQLMLYNETPQSYFPQAYQQKQNGLTTAITILK